MSDNDKQAAPLPEECAESLELVALGKHLLANAVGEESTHRRLDMTRIAIEQALEACKGLPPEAQLRKDARENKEKREAAEEKLLLPMPEPRVRRYGKSASLS